MNPSWLRRALLLYRPRRRRAWLHRALFYFLAFLVLPILSLAAMGAYVGPEHTLAGIPAVLVIAALAIVVRSRALRADASLRKAHGPDEWRPITEGWPFPLEPPPRRRVVRGYLESALGILLMALALMAFGLAANALIWPFIVASGVEIESNFEIPPLSVVIAVAVVVAFLSPFIGLYVHKLGTRLRDRGRRFRARDARAMLQRPGEQPVLLLRSFADEELVDPRPVSLLERRYEETLARALKQIGPVITVGRPGDSLGFAGAARFYVSREHWQPAVRYLMLHSAAVVIIVGRTEGLWWEISTALECVARQNLLFFFPLVDKPSAATSTFAALVEFVKRWNLPGRKMKQMEVEHRARYQLFRDRTARQLREVLPNDLNKAFFFDFLPDGQVRVLRQRYRLMRNVMLDLVPNYRRMRFDMTLTLWPFMAKLYEGQPQRADKAGLRV